MRIQIIILITLLIVSCGLLVGCSGKPSKTCNQDSDCKSVSGCVTGCYNKYYLPSQPKDKFCGVLGPFECSCVDNVCIDTGLSDCSSGYLCFGGQDRTIKVGEQAVFPMIVKNQDVESHIFYLIIKQGAAEDNQHNPISYNLSPIVQKNELSLDPGKSEKQLIKIRSNEQTPTGTYLFVATLESEDKNITYSTEFFLKIE